MFDVANVRRDFPTLHQIVNDEPLIYFDNAATTQKPQCVLDEVVNFYNEDNANVHRGVHTLSERATSRYEEARKTVQQFIGAHSTKEILFTRGTTTSLNWVAQGFGRQVVQKGDEIIISLMDHHANIVPWQQLAKEKQAKLRYVSFDERGRIDLEHFQTLLNNKTKIVALPHVSNVLGSENDIRTLGRLAHQVGAYIIVDGAQSTPHQTIDVVELDCDFFAFSGHKLCAPTGIGVLYGKQSLLEKMDPVEFGGEMIDFVYEHDSTWTQLPWKFEAGTPNIAGALGLQSAICYLQNIGMDNIHHYNMELSNYLLQRLLTIDGLTLYGSHEENDHCGVFSFNLDGIHPHDVATALDMEGVAVRAGHHCAQPLMRALSIPAAVRASVYFYNTKEEVDQFIDALQKVKEYFNDGFI